MESRVELLDLIELHYFKYLNHTHRFMYRRIGESNKYLVFERMSEPTRPTTQIWYGQHRKMYNSQELKELDDLKHE